MSVDWFAVLPLWAAICLLAIEYGIKIVAIGVVPQNRRPSSAQTWLLLILFVPLVGLVAYWLIGSQYLVGRRHRIQARANDAILAATEGLDFVPADVYRSLSPGARGVVRLTRSLTAMPLVMGRCTSIQPDYDASLAAMTAAVREAKQFVHLEMFILSHDDDTAEFFAALSEAVARGVKVRVLFDHMGSWRYPGYRATLRAMTAGGVEWHAMLPIQPYRLRWRRPDLRNHRKLLVVDNEVGFIGSQNLITSSYRKRKNLKAGRHWKDLNVSVAGPLVADLNVVFCLDWLTETGEGLFDLPQLGPRWAQPLPERAEDTPAPVATAVTASPRPAGSPAAHGLVADHASPGENPVSELITTVTESTRDEPFQLLPSGPGFVTEPNLRVFNALIYLARRSVCLVSPYFVPDESLLMALTTAAQRGVRVDLVVSEVGDQFWVDHAQRSYYEALLVAGVRIWLYPKPTVLHAKHFTIDDAIAVVGSSNLDMRSFWLDYEVSLIGYGRRFTEVISTAQRDYLSVCRELTLDAWLARPMLSRWVDNVARLTSALQ